MRRSTLPARYQIAAALFACFPVAFPLYYASAGMPQPSSILLVLASGLTLSQGLLIVSSAWRVAGLLIAFIGYVAVVNLGWAVALADTRPAFFVLYYIYNGFAFLVTLCLYTRVGLMPMRWMQHGTALAVALQVVVTFVLGENDIRAMATFNNPNQLGYFAVVAGVLFLVASDVFRTSTPYKLSVLAGCSVLSVASVSLAAIAAMSALLIVAILQNRRLATAAAVIAAIGLVIGARTGIMEPVRKRAAEGAGSSVWESRGYDRIVNHPEHLAFGAGEGVYASRFESSIATHEMHSSLGTILFSYGVVGLTLYLSILGLIVWLGGARLTFYIAPIFVYGIAHQGLRSTFVWIVLAWICAVGCTRRARSRPCMGLAAVRRPSAA